MKDFFSGLFDNITLLKSKSNEFLSKLKSKTYYRVKDENQHKAINKLIQLINNKEKITPEVIEELHEILLDGSFTQKGKYLRNNNTIYIGVPEERIDYIAIDYHNIEFDGLDSVVS